MNRSRALLLVLPLTFAAACRDPSGAGGLDAGSGDGGPQPDATPVVRLDAGPVDAGPRPTLASVTPGAGTERGGTRVTLRGTSFTEPATVLFGDQPAVSVVVLDEVSIAATTPPNSPGSVAVKVTTPAGTAELADGFRYHRELLLLDVSPARLPDQGGVLVTVTGKGFDEHTLILFDRKPLAGAVWVDAEHIRGYAPSLAPGRPEIRALTPEAEARRSDLAVVYGTPEVQALAPGYGPVGGASPQSLAGRGFTEATRVLVGGRQAEALVIDSDAQLGARFPRLAAGAHDVVVENRDARGALAAGYLAYDPSRAGFEVLGATPRRASARGGEVVAVVGYGFARDAAVTIGGVPATVMGGASANVLHVLVPPGLPAGAKDVEVSSSLLGGAALGAGALELYAPISVATVTPTTGPALGGTMVTITGAGFVPGVTARIGDVPLADVVVVSDTELTGRTVAGVHGPAEVVVQSPDTSGRLAGAFRYVEPYELIRIEPREGSIAGNTHVTVFGRGLDAPAAVRFGANAGNVPTLENGSVLSVRTLPAGTGRVDVAVSTGASVSTLPRAYAFYDPKLLTGGAWGGPIEGSVNVAVLDPGSGNGVEGATVQLGYDADPRYRALTDANGLATISSPEVRGPYTVTAGKNGFEFVTFTEVNARNLTMFSSAYPSSPSPDDPVPPCPEGADAPRVRGRVFRFKSSLDPVTNPGWIPLAIVTYSQPNVFANNPPQPAEQQAIVTTDGEEYEIVVMRAGVVAVYAILGDFNQSTQEFIPRKMGIARNVPAAPGVVTEAIDLALDIDMTQSITIHLDGPPNQVPGPTLNAVFPYLNLQSEGVIAFDPTSVGASDVTLERLPELATSQFFYMGGSFTVSEGGGLGAPYSLTLRESGEAFQEGLELGPFVQMPANVSPKASQVIEHGTFAWDQGGVKPDVATMAVVDVTTVGGCCCADLNGNGQCEDLEPQQCGALPQQFTRWSLFAQGGRESYAMPMMASGVDAFESPNTYFWIVEQAVAPRFDYREFIYNQFSPFFWTSWSVWYSQFVSKEETR